MEYHRGAHGSQVPSAHVVSYTQDMETGEPYVLYPVEELESETREGTATPAPTVLGLAATGPDGAPTSTGRRNSTTKRIPRREKNYTVKEDEMLCVAYLNVSKEIVVSSNQSSGGYWARIFEYYHEHKEVPSERSLSSLQHRWGGIQKETTRFCGFYDEVQKRSESENSDDDMLNDALHMFKDIVGSSFPYTHCWRILRHEKKWNDWLASLIHKDKAATVPPSSADRSSDAGDCQASLRPIGRDRAKKQRSQKNSAHGVSEIGEPYVHSVDELESETEEDIVTPVPPVVEIVGTSPNGAATCTGRRMQTTKRIPRREKNYTIMEDEMLCVAYLNVSKDPIVGCNQSSGRYWTRIFEYYHEHKEVPSERSLSSLQHRWGSIQKDTTRFCVFYDIVQKRNESGENDIDMVKDALKMFEGNVGSSFSYTHCWCILRHEKKWNDWLDSLTHEEKAAMVTPSPPDRSSNAGDCQASVRPIGHPVEELESETREGIVTQVPPVVELVGTGPNGAATSTVRCKQTTKRIPRREKNYTIMEDEMLCVAWLNVSKDPIVGFNQSSGSYWARIVEYYHEHKEVPSERSLSSLQHRWCTIQKDTTRFCVFYDIVKKKNESRKNDVDKMKDALKMFEGDMGSSFSYTHCWCILRHEKKWNDWLASLTHEDKAATAPPSPANRSSNPGDCQASVRPIARDRAQKQRSQGYSAHGVPYTPGTNIGEPYIHPVEELESETREGIVTPLPPVVELVGTGPNGADQSSDTGDCQALVWPIERDRAKKQRIQGNSSSSSTACLEVLQKMSEDRFACKERQDEHSRDRDLLSHADRKLAALERLAAAQERLAAVQEFEQEQRIMSIDADKVVPWQRDYYLRLQKQIIQKHTNGGI